MDRWNSVGDSILVLSVLELLNISKFKQFFMAFSSEKRSGEAVVDNLYKLAFANVDCEWMSMGE